MFIENRIHQITQSSRGATCLICLNRGLNGERGEEQKALKDSVLSVSLRWIFLTHRVSRIVHMLTRCG